MGHEWDDDRPPFAGLRWRWLRWRARHYAHIAYLDYHRRPTQRNQEALDRANEKLSRIELARP